MKYSQNQRSKVFMLLTLLFAIAAIFQLQARIRVESHDKAIAVVMLQEDIGTLAESSGADLESWYQSLSNAGLSAVIVPAEQMNQTDIIAPIEAADLEVAQLGGERASGLYFAQVEYDIQVSGSNTADCAVAAADSGRTWVMVENNPQTGCVLPDRFDVTNLDGPWAKGFYLRQNTRARAATTELGDAQEVGDMLFRAVADRGVQVLWIAPLGDEEGLDDRIETYESLLDRLETRIERCGYHYGIPQGMDALSLPRPVLILCGCGIFAAAMLLLCLLFPIGNRLAWFLYAICIAECAAGGLLRPTVQEILLALGASVVFPSLSVFYLGKKLQNANELRTASLWHYLCTVMTGVLITVLGGAYIGAVLGSWKYILVLQVFRGVKLSQAAVYLFAIILLGWMLLELRKDNSPKSLLNSIDRKLLVRMVSVVIIFAGAGLIYLMRSGDGMIGVSSIESRLRAALENWVLFRPRTKEFLIAWPAIALAFCFAARKDRLLAWLFGVMGSVGFASVANTFCHIRAHFLVSIARTALGLIIGFLIGTLLFILIRPSKE